MNFSMRKISQVNVAINNKICKTKQCSWLYLLATAADCFFYFYTFYIITWEFPYLKIFSFTNSRFPTKI